MEKLLRIIGAAWGAKKIGGGKCGCFGTIFVFLILYWLLGYVFDVLQNKKSSNKVKIYWNFLPKA